MASRYVNFTARSDQWVKVVNGKTSVQCFLLETRSVFLLIVDAGDAAPSAGTLPSDLAGVILAGEREDHNEVTESPVDIYARCMVANETCVISVRGE